MKLTEITTGYPLPAYEPDALLLIERRGRIRVFEAWGPGDWGERGVSTALFDPDWVTPESPAWLVTATEENHD